MRHNLAKNKTGPFYCGIDIGAHALKLTVLEANRRRLAVCYTAWERTPENTIQNGIITDRRKVATQLRAMVRQSGLAVTEAAITLPIEETQIRWIDLPPMSDEALEAATRFEARKHLSSPVETAEVQILLSDEKMEEDEGRFRAILTAASRELVSNRAETLELAGLSVSAMEPEPYAILRALQSRSDTRDSLWIGQPVVFVHIGHQNSFLCVLQETHLRFVRAMAWGSQRLTQPLAEALMCPEEAAEAIKTSPSASVAGDGRFLWETENGPAQTEALAAEFDRLGREIQRLLNYYRSLFAERSYEGILDHLVICGGIAGIHGLQHYLQQRLTLATVVGNPFVASGLFLSEEVAGRLAHHQNSFASSVGLALGQAEAAAPELESQSRIREYVWRRKAA